MFRSLKRKIQNELSKKSIFSTDKNLEIAQIELEPAHDDVIIETEIKQENSDILKTAIRKLTDQQQQALFLKFEQNLSYPEIAEILNISTESARTNIYRAIKALRISIQKGHTSFNMLLMFYRLYSRIYR